MNDHCWICEGWTAYDFEFQPEEWIDVDIIPVKLHVSCDRYEGELLAIDVKKSAALN